MFVTGGEFRGILPKICDSGTSADPDGWTEDNPLWGHCAVVSLLAQNLFGGKLMRASLEGTEFASMRSHYFNKFPLTFPDLPSAEAEIWESVSLGYTDFTKAQFGDRYPTNVFGACEERTREYLLGNEETRDRYKVLAIRFAREYTKAAIFNDWIYKHCLYLALDSPCQKMWFGSVITKGDHGPVMGVGCNRTIDPLKHICEPECIRNSIPSRTESMIGACGHAEEWAQAEAQRVGHDLREGHLYVAGLFPNGLPWLKDQAKDHSCIRCSVRMFQNGIHTVWVPTPNGWSALTTAEAVEKSMKYALGDKQIAP